MQPTLEADIKARRVVVAEVDPPRGTNAAKEIEGARQIVEAGADAITIADNPLSIMRMSNLALATLLMREMKSRILLHIACRDRSLIGTQSHILGAHALGISNILAVTGDPVATQAYQGSSGVFDMASHKLIELISRFNNGEFATGRDGDARTNFFVGGAFNSASRKIENEVKRFQRKIQSGSSSDQDVFLVGDHNRDATSPWWTNLTGLSPTVGFKVNDKTSINTSCAFASPYDHFWYQGSYVSEYSSSGRDYIANMCAFRDVSDHAPVYLSLYSSADTD
jgi:hypothetical protein